MLPLLKSTQIHIAEGFKIVYWFVWPTHHPGAKCWSECSEDTAGVQGLQKMVVTQCRTNGGVWVTPPVKICQFYLPVQNQEVGILFELSGHAASYHVVFHLTKNCPCILKPFMAVINLDCCSCRSVVGLCTGQNNAVNGPNNSSLGYPM